MRRAQVIARRSGAYVRAISDSYAGSCSLACVGARSTLWHLISRTHADDRRAVVERLAVLVPPPESVDTLDRPALESWWRAIRHADDTRRSTPPPG